MTTMNKRNIKRIMMITGLLFSLNSVKGQAQDKGIRFEQLSWERVIAKAKAEHKYIFLDCYATWCGPCKLMDANVYPLQEVGKVYNRQFISVRVQMDKRKNDDEQIKQWYPVAEDIQQTYTINAFPTFLFLDPDGNAVHKFTGSLQPENFIRLASEALDTNKQYYRVLKNFQPGKLDTSELKALARGYARLDLNLAGKLAADYLRRIPVEQLNQRDNGKLMAEFKSNSQVSQIAVDFICKLNKAQLTSDEMIGFIAQFKDNSTIKEIARGYIDQLTEDELYRKGNIAFLALFTETTADRGFPVFYLHAAKVDAVMGKKDYARAKAESVIYSTELSPAINAAKKTCVTPDFKAISETITRKYNADFAERIISYGKVSWYNYLVNDKKDERYWPDLISCTVERINRFRLDTLSSSAYFINNVAYGEIFDHSDDQAQLGIAINWMKIVVNKNPDGYYGYLYSDTYSSLLYKINKIQEALTWANKALELARIIKYEEFISNATKKIEAMKRGEKIWLEKEFQ